MLIRLFVFLMLLSAVASAQSNATVNRLLVKDSMGIGGRWIREIRSDSTMNGTNEGTISTDGAWKSYILNNVRNSPLSPVPGPARDSALTIDPATGKLGITPISRPAVKQFEGLTHNPWLKVSAGPLVNGVTIVEDTIHVECMSSDGIKSIITFNGAYPDWNYAKGKAPFTVKTDWVNRHPGKFVLLDITSAFYPNGRQPFNRFFAAYNDTIHFKQNCISSDIFFEMRLSDSLPNCVIMPITVRNRTSGMISIRSADGTNIILPHEELRFKIWYGSGLGVGYQKVLKSATGELILCGLDNHPLRCLVYENETLTNTVTADSYYGFLVPINDPSSRLELVVEDMPIVSQ
ncbi:MAG: hypothetical protein JO154_20605 [Chitinophaga sp.]|uniref:hypothetical protein n=1 Tax=Chitinophaga sp. TaxID=1869181 RepID=UPI0025C0FA28|nr:hypothetical protein [Chitinophaga sp.]MBV8255014.1 hypothetical protein [Chitinophaga sp.]